jgi:hypothetical protein
VRSYTIRLALVGLAAWAIWMLLPSDEKVIRKTLSGLAAVVSVTPNDSTLVRLAKSEKLRDFFSQDVEIHFESEGWETQHIIGRADLVSIAAAARTQFRKAKIQLLDVHVKFGDDQESATAYMTLLGDLDSEKNAISQELKMALKKIEGDWLITRVETIKTLR